MNEAQGPVPLPPSRKRGGPWLLLLLLAIAAGVGGWRGYQWITERLGMETSQQHLLARLTDEVGALRARSEQLSNQETQLETRLAGSEQVIGRVSETLEGGRSRLQLAAVEQLLLMANDRLLLAQDASGARVALDQADQRLAALNDPRLLKVREALTRERAALAALPEVDRTGAALRLAEMIRSAPRFLLRARVPDRFETAPALAAETATVETWSQRAWNAVKRVLSSIFSLRRNAGPAPRLLPPEEEVLVTQALQLKLEGARLALLARDPAALRDLATGARDWLHDYYNDSDPSVIAARAELEKLAHLDAGPAAPDISRSLVLLREQLGGAGR